MGLAAAWMLARRGADVTVLERFSPIHELGSHGGYTRIIRKAYHEGSGYVQLVHESEIAWADLAARAGETLLVRCGLLEVGPPDDPDLQAMLDVCDACGIPHEPMDGAAARTRWPVDVPDDWVACFTPGGGYLRVNPCMRAMRREAEGAGAVVRPHARVVAIERGDPQGPAAVLEGGERIVADHLVVSAGAWLPELLPDLLGTPIVRMRRLLGWTEPPLSHRPTLASMPVWAAFLPRGFFYGFPYNEEGVAGFKLACHTTREIAFLNDPVDPETVDRSADARSLELLEEFLAEHLPLAQGPWVETKVCLYTVTPTWDFVVDRLPEDPRIVVAGGFSGHGFKFAPAVGRLVADLIMHESAPLEMFSIARHRALTPP